MEFGLVGAKPENSRSVPIHAMLGVCGYRFFERTEAQFVELLKSRAFRGLNVAPRYGRLAYEHCDALSDDAREVGRVDALLVRPDGSLYGHNTAPGGFVAMARRAGVGIAGRRVVILDSDGSAPAARTACRQLGALKIATVRLGWPADREALYRDHADAQVLINTTPVGMYPRNGVAPADIARFPRLEGVLDAICDPDRTALILDAEARGLACAGGLYMRVARARESAELFLGRRIPEDEVLRVYRKLKDESLNLVLIGMPGCGKGRIGRMLADAMGRPFVDCDAQVEAHAGKPIPEIFAHDGERAFRDLESAVLADLCRERGRVVASGGGAVLRPQNVRAMRQNGRIALLERDLESLSMDGRPLSVSIDALRNLWVVREPLYRAAADFAVDNNGAPEDTARRAEMAFHEAVDR